MYLINYGGVGVIIEMTMKLVDKFYVHQAIYQDFNWDSLYDDA